MKLNEAFEEKRKSVKEKLDDIKIVLKENPELAAKVIAAGVSVGFVVIKAAVKHHELAEAKELKDCRVYDRRCGHYVTIKRPIKATEWSEIDYRYSNGESYSSIMSDMNLLK